MIILIHKYLEIKLCKPSVEKENFQVIVLNQDLQIESQPVDLQNVYSYNQIGGIGTSCTPIFKRG